jgi:hypothetical protein
MQCRGIGKHGTVRDSKSSDSRLPNFAAACRIAPEVGIRCRRRGIDETRADGWAKVGVRALREETGDEGWFVGYIAGGLYIRLQLNLSRLQG